jgi:hypothetical protein
MIESLLNKRVNLRVCEMNQFKNSKFFKNFNWNDLTEMKMRPPFKPDNRDYRNNLDSCNYPFEEVINVIFLNIV